jgi:hypothetical protein
MNAEQYCTVFDVTTAGFRNWQFSAFGLLFIAIGLLLPTLIKKGVFPNTPPWMQRWFPRLFLGFAIFWTVISFAASFTSYQRALYLMRSGRAQVVEGVVTDFAPMPYTGHAMESFTVNGTRFEYSDYVLTAGFNNTSSHGGPVKEGLPVKIWHVNGEILRLDARINPVQLQRKYVDPFWRFFAVWMTLGVVSFLFFQFNRNARLKRTLWPVFVITASALFIVFMSSMGFRGPAWYIFIPAIVLITILNLRNTRFCSTCGRTIHSQNILSPPRFCPKCGSELRRD